jgi:uncharacterized protein YlbG (UPF0298 family)
MFFMSFKLKNHDAIVEELTEMLMKFDKSFNEYNTAVYLYYNEETQEATLDEFVYVGISWRDDDHITIYVDDQHYDDIYEHIDYIEVAVSEALDMNIDDIKKAVSEWLDIDIDDIDECDIAKWAEEKFYEKMHSYYNEWFIDEYRADYLERAENIICDFEESYEENM